MDGDDAKTMLRNFLDGEGRLKLYPAKTKYKLCALCYLASRFEAGVKYEESDVNGILNKWHLFGDPAMLRRELFDYHFLDREKSGRAYWLREEQPSLEALLAAIR